MRKKNISRALAVALSIVLASGNTAPIISFAAQEVTQVSEDETTEVMYDLAEEVIEETSEESVEETSEEPVEETSEEPVEEVAEEIICEETTEESLSYDEEIVNTAIEATTILEYEAPDGTYSLKYQFREIDGEKQAVIKKFGDKKADEIEIPAFVSADSSYDGYEEYQNIPVTAIDQNAFIMFDGQGALVEENCPVSVVIPATVETIGMNAFAAGNTASTRLKTVILEEGSQLREIGYFAFQNQTALSSEITIPETVMSIGNQAFENCKSISTLNILGGSIIGDKAFYGCTKVEGGLTLPEDVLSIGDEAFLNYGKETEGGQLVLPDNLETIGEKAFSNAKFYGDLTIPASVTSIGKNAFVSAFITQEPSLMGTLTFKTNEQGVSNLTEISDYTFQKCIGLDGELQLPDSVTKIGNYAFSECSNLNGKLTLSKILNSIGSNAFYKCQKLSGNLVIPNTVTQIGAAAFKECKGFNGTLTLSTSLNTIPGECFYNCTGLTGKLVIPEGITSVQQNAFRSCTLLDGTLTLPSSLTAIGGYAFADCELLNGDLTIPEGVTIISNNSFMNCKSFSALYMPKEATEIQSSAFSGCVGFSNELVLPEALKKVGQSAFEGCKLMTGNIILADTVTSIGASAFSGMIGLDGYLYLSNKLTNFGQSCFNGCENLKNKKDENGKDICIEIAENTKSLPQFMFNGCENLTSIKLPRTITTINSGAFAKTNSGLNVYVYAGSSAAKTIRSLSAGEKTFNVQYIDMLDAVVLSSDVITMRVGNKRPLSALLRYYVYDEELKNDVIVYREENETDDKLEWTITPNKYINYNDGVITGITKGTENITVTPPEGLKATCKVNVVDNYVTAVSMNATTTISFDMSKANEKQEVSATVKLVGVKEAIENGDMKPEDLKVTWNTSVADTLDVEVGDVTFNEDYTEATAVASVAPLKNGNLTLSVTATVEGDAKTFTSTLRKVEIVNPVTNLELPAEITLKKGKTVNLASHVKVTPENATATYTWKSSDTSVATVSTTGVVTPKATGTVEITCSAAGSLDTAEPSTCRITVVDQYVTAVKLDDYTDLTLNKGSDAEGVELSAEVELNGFSDAIKYYGASTEDLKISWKQSAYGVITFEPGDIVFSDDYTSATMPVKVIPQRSGNTKVTVTATVTGDANKVVSDERNVKVIVPLTDITMLDKTTVKVGKTIDLAETLEYTPEDASTVNVTWTSSNDNIATVSAEGVITAKSAGTVTITCTPKNEIYDTAKPVTCTITVIDSYIKDVVIQDTSDTTLDLKKAGESVTVTAVASLQGYKDALDNEMIKNSDFSMTMNQSDTASVKMVVEEVVFDDDYKTATLKATITPLAVGTCKITATAKLSDEEVTTKTAKNITVETEKTTLPVVQNVKAKNLGRNKVQLTWQATEDESVDGYLIYAKKNGKYAYCGMVASRTTTSYIDTKAMDTEFNFYWVYTYKKNDDGSMDVGPVGKYVYGKGVCLAVTNLKASSLVGGVKLSWTASQGADGYLVYGMNKADRKYHYIGMTSTTSFTDKKADTENYNFYWIIPYHKDASGKMIAGQICSKYTYGKAR